MMERHPHLTMFCRGAVVEFRVAFVYGKQVMVLAIGVTVQLCHREGFCLHVGRLYQSVHAGLVPVCSVDIEVFVVDVGRVACVGRAEGGNGMKAVWKMAVVPVPDILSRYQGIVPVRSFRPVPGSPRNLVFHVIVVHHGLLVRSGVCLVGADLEVGGEQ